MCMYQYSPNEASVWDNQWPHHTNHFQCNSIILHTCYVIKSEAIHYKLAQSCTLLILVCYAAVAAMIRGNHDNCREFATQRWLRVFMDQLSCPSQSHHVLDVIQCLITDSPEVLHIISQRDIGCIVKLLHSNGRDAKVRDNVCVDCVVISCKYITRQLSRKIDPLRSNKDRVYLLVLV